MILFFFFSFFSSGFRGYGCTDNRYNRLSKYLPSVLFLTLSNLMFLPAIILAVYNRLYIEGLIYFFNMFFSTVNFRYSLSSRCAYIFSFIMPAIKKSVDFVY